VSAYPEHDKLPKVVDESQSIGQFLEWLIGPDGYVLARWYPGEDDDDELFPESVDIEALFAKYFLFTIADEKDQMLAYLRRMNEEAGTEGGNGMNLDQVLHQAETALSRYDYDRAVPLANLAIAVAIRELTDAVRGERPVNHGGPM
jgi:hypothetical protein